MFPDLVFCYFYQRHNTRYFQIINFHDRSIYSWLCPHIFFNFFKSLKFEFFEGLNKGLQCAHVPKRRTLFRVFLCYFYQRHNTRYLLPMFVRMRFVLFEIILEGRVFSCLPVHVKLREIWFDLFCISCILALGLNHCGSRATRVFF
jgi:hypothetical protein